MVASFASLKDRWIRCERRGNTTNQQMATMQIVTIITPHTTLFFVRYLRRTEKLKVPDDDGDKHRVRRRWTHRTATCCRRENDL